VSDQPEDAKAGKLRTEEAAEDELEGAEEEQPGAAAHEELVEAATVEAATQEMPAVAAVAESPIAPQRVRKIDFVSRRNWYFLFSLLIIIPGIFYMVHSGFRLGIDFAGGTEFTVNFPGKPTQAQVENAVAADIAGGSVISTGNGGYIIRTPPLTPAQQKTFEDQLRTGLGTYDLQQVLEVGGTIAGETIELALLSVVLAAVAILLLLTFRFRNVPGGWRAGFQFGGSALAALLHDVFLLTGVFAILGKGFDLRIGEINSLFVTAVLTVVMDNVAPDTAITLGSGDPALPYFQACKAMANYRLGRFPEAIVWGEKAANSSLDFAQAKAYAILAMAHWHLGQKDTAREALAKGEALAPGIAPGSEPEDIGESWVAWLIARISLDEAAALIQPASAADNNSTPP